MLYPACPLVGNRTYVGRRQYAAGENPDLSFQEATKRISKSWLGMTAEDKQPYEVKSIEAGMTLHLSLRCLLSCACSLTECGDVFAESRAQLPLSSSSGCGRERPPSSC